MSDPYRAPGSLPDSFYTDDTAPRGGFTVGGAPVRPSTLAAPFRSLTPDLLRLLGWTAEEARAVLVPLHRPTVVEVRDLLLRRARTHDANQAVVPGSDLFERASGVALFGTDDPPGPARSGPMTDSRIPSLPPHGTVGGIFTGCFADEPAPVLDMVLVDQTDGYRVVGAVSAAELEGLERMADQGDELHAEDRLELLRHGRRTGETR